VSLAPDYAARSLWSDDASYPQGSRGPLPARADVVIVGAGYTGLAAARETARAGRSTLLFDAGPIGGGCSSRNGGQVAFSIKPDFATLGRRHGADIATRLYREAFAAIAELREFAHLPGVDCDWRDSGCFFGAHTQRQFDNWKRAVDAQPPGFEVPVRVVPRGALAAETGSRLYAGGFVYPEDAAVHPLRLLNALYQRAIAAGAAAYADCAVLGLERASEGFSVRTAHGTVHAQQVLLATNGYTGALSPWHRRRIIPIGSYIIATEPLDPALVERLLPRGRNLVDTRHVVIYVRPSPDGRRVVFGGRAAATETDSTECVPRLKAMLTEVFPELQSAAISRSWMGFVGYTFDTLPHLGDDAGLFYCMGYCGQGVPLALYYGRRIGLKMVGDRDGATALDGIAFPTRPFYSGRPWFLPAAVLGYRLRDALGW
jgi:glycine/D-amino acid oxidase-like deaminating enzyme